MNPAHYDAIYSVGGHGTMWDFPDQPGRAGLAEAIAASGGVVSAVCHGPAGLLGLRQADGRPFVAGRRVAAFANEEERAASHENDVSFLLETRLASSGAGLRDAAGMGGERGPQGAPSDWAEPGIREGRGCVRIVIDTAALGQAS